MQDIRGDQLNAADGCLLLRLFRLFRTHYCVEYASWQRPVDRKSSGFFFAKDSLRQPLRVTTRTNGEQSGRNQKGGFRIEFHESYCAPIRIGLRLSDLVSSPHSIILFSGEITL
jgi:hypothetical protein